MDRRKITSALLALAGSVGPLSVSAQRADASPRIGVLLLTSLATAKPSMDGFRSSLRELGLVDGRNIHLEVLSAEGNADRLPELAAQLVARRVDIIVAGGGNASTIAARNVTQTIPIIMTLSINAVEAGLVQSLARPGGNVTGMTAPLDLGLKQIQLLKELIPALSRLVVLVRHDQLSPAELQGATMAVQALLGLTPQFVEVRSPQDLQRALAAIRTARAEAMIVSGDPLLYQQREQIVAFARAAKIADVTPAPDMIDAGALLYYGPNLQELYRGVARFIDRILKGAKPADLPVEQPTLFELAINLGTAKALGLKVPQTILLRAERTVD